MTRRWTGWLAWGALALVIGGPSADIFFFREDNNTTATAEAEQQAFVGPLPVESAQTAEPAEVPLTNVAAIDPVVLPDAPVTLPETPPVIELAKPAFAIEEKIRPAQVEPAIPLDFRIVGDQRMVTALRPVEDLPDVKSDVEDLLIKTPEPVAVLEAEEAEPGELVLPLETAIVEPVPLPRLRRSDALPEITPLDDSLVSVPVETMIPVREESTVVVTSVEEERLTLQEAQELSPGPQRLDIANQASSGAANRPTNSGFSELWDVESRPRGFTRNGGSFAEQLPETRGSSVRLDLLQ